LGISKFDLPFPGMKYLFRRSQEINQGPISLKELNEYTLSKQSGDIRNARQFRLRDAMELRMSRDAKNLKQEKLSKRETFLLGLLDQALETEGNPLASLTQIQLDGLIEQLEGPSLSPDADAKIEARSDVDLVSEFGTVGFYGVAVAKANLVPEVLDVITTVDRAINPSFFGFATWRAKKIEAGEYEDNIDAAKNILKGDDGLTGAMGRRGDQSRRLLRRADSAESLTGAMIVAIGHHCSGYAAQPGRSIASRGNDARTACSRATNGVPKMDGTIRTTSGGTRRWGAGYHILFPQGRRHSLQ